MSNGTHERGAALIGAVLLVVILSMLGMVSLNVAAQEIESIAAARDEAVARHLAEAGADLVMQWFHDPSSTPQESVGELFTKRQLDADGEPSFFGATGQSQFTGTADHPDLVFDATNPADHRRLNDPSDGWFRALHSVGHIRKLAVYGATSPGLLCTVEVTAEARNVTRTISLQLGARAIPPIRAAVRIGNREPVQATGTPLQVFVHWGDLIVHGDVQLGAALEVPVRTGLAPVTGQSYAGLMPREDRWLNILVGGAALFTPVGSGPVAVPSNVHAHQEPVPGLRRDQWEYQAMKKQALRDGTYYARGPDGLLYRQGRIEPGLGVTAGDAFRSETVGDHQGLVFVDTLDQAPPRADNLGTVVFDSDYAEGLFVINANVLFTPKGTGQSVSAFSPPLEHSGSPGTRLPVELTGIHLRGALVTPGRVAFEGQPRIYGALVVGGTVEQASKSDDRLEVWYDYDFLAGFFRGTPLVYHAPGTWQEMYGTGTT